MSATRHLRGTRPSGVRRVPRVCLRWALPPLLLCLVGGAGANAGPPAAAGPGREIAVGPYLLPEDGRPAPDIAGGRRAEYLRLQAEIHRRYSDWWTDGWGYTVARNTPPVLPGKTNVDVNVGMFFYSLLGVNEVEGLFEISFWLRLSWRDPTITWNKTEHGGITDTVADPNLIWTPDFIIYNSADETQGQLRMTQPYVYHMGDGEPALVWWSRPGTARVRCRSEDINAGRKAGAYRPFDAKLRDIIGVHWPSGIDLSRYPFDTQYCEMVLASWRDSGLRVNFTLMEKAVEPSPEQAKEVGTGVGVASPEFHVAAIHAEVIQKYYICCPKEPWPTFYYYFTMRRYTVDYIQNIILPVIFLTYIGFFGFLIPSNGGERVSLGVTCLLTILAVMYITTDDTPRTWRITLLSIFYNGSLAFTILPLIVTCISAYMLNRQRADDQLDDMLNETLEMMRLVLDEEEHEARGHGWQKPSKDAYPSPRNRARFSLRASSSQHENSHFHTATFAHVIKRLPSHAARVTADILHDNVAARFWRLRHLIVMMVFSGGKHNIRALNSFAWERAGGADAYEKLSVDRVRHVFPSPEEIAELLDHWGAISLSVGYTAFLILLAVISGRGRGDFIYSVLYFTVAFVVFGLTYFMAVYLGHLERKVAIEMLYRRDHLPPEMDEKTVKMYRNHFMAFDRDLNGFITPAELISVYRKQGQKVDEHMLRQRLGRMDPNDDEAISFEEFVDLLQRERAIVELRKALKAKNAGIKAGLNGHTEGEEAPLTAEERKIPVKKWGVEDVSKWLARNGFGHLSTPFAQHGIDGSILMSLTAEELKVELGVLKLRDRRGIIELIGRLAESEVKMKFSRGVAAVSQMLKTTKRQLRAHEFIPAPNELNAPVYETTSLETT